MSNLIIPGNVPDIKAQAELKLKLAAIKANQDKLDKCQKHLLDKWPKGLTIGVRFTCANCKGSIDAINAYQYTLGYKAAGGNPEDIMPGWNNYFDPECSVVTGDGFKKNEANSN